MSSDKIASELFDYTGESPKLEWCIDKLVPWGQLVFNVAQSHSGKSWYGEAIATCIAYGQPFLGLKTIEGDVLIIDQDTPVETLKRRLRRFGKYYGTTPKHKVYLLAMQNLCLRDGSLQAAVLDHPKTAFVLIDSLHAVCPGIDPDNTRDMMGNITKFKQTCLRPNCTIMFNHHISEKLDLSPNDLMTCNPHKLAMGNSSIIQQADAYYIIAQSQNMNGRLTKVSVRPVSKRDTIPIEPFTITLHDDDDDSSSVYFGNLVIYQAPKHSCAEDILQLFRLKKTPLTCKEIFDAQGQDYPQNEIRTTLRILEAQGLLTKSSEAHNLFKYDLSKERVGQTAKLGNL